MSRRCVAQSTRLQYVDVLSAQSAVPITFACNWGGGTTEDYRLPPVDFDMKTGDIAFIASNCNGGGALFRTRYVEELMKCTLRFCSIIGYMYL